MNAEIQKALKETVIMFVRKDVDTIQSLGKHKYIYMKLRDMLSETPAEYKSLITLESTKFIARLYSECIDEVLSTP